MVAGCLGDQAVAFGQRWVACYLRLHSVTVLLVEVYLFTAQGLSGPNLEMLGQLFRLFALHRCPTICAGDWNLAPKELIASGWPDRCGLTVLAPLVDSTCTSGRHGG